MFFRGRALPLILPEKRIACAPCKPRRGASVKRRLENWLRVNEANFAPEGWSELRPSRTSSPVSREPRKRARLLRSYALFSKKADSRRRLRRAEKTTVNALKTLRNSQHSQAAMTGRLGRKASQPSSRKPPSRATKTRWIARKKLAFF